MFLLKTSINAEALRVHSGSQNSEMQNTEPNFSKHSLNGFYFSCDDCLEQGVLFSKKAHPTLKKMCWQMTTEQVHVFKCIIYKEK